MDGIIVVNKEKGFTSFDVVAKLRGILKMKKIGHTGTLDPDATGVLPVCLGCGTKLCDMLTDSSKEYVAEITLGMTSDTQDITGEILSQSEVWVSEEEFMSVVSSFVGQQLQIPPMYSALKVNGQRLYDLARQGKTVEREARPITVYEIEVLSLDLPKAKLRIACSKGTYIRTICHDIGQKLGCGAVMSSLQRTKAAGYPLSEARTLDEIEAIMKDGKIDEIIHPISECFKEESEVVVKAEFEKLADNGNKLTSDMFTSNIAEEQIKKGRIKVMKADGMFYGIYEFDQAENQFKPIKLFFCK